MEGNNEEAKHEAAVVFCLSIVVGVVFLRAVPAAAQLGITVSNWPVPSASSGSHGAMTTQSDVTAPLPFIGVTPCRVVDTRLPAGPFGGPFLAVGSPRSFTIPNGPCAGLPPYPSAYSLNITVTNTQGKGFILLYPQGGAQPLVSTLNYSGLGQTVANAAIVPAGINNGGITVAAGVHGTNLIIDINGYYAEESGTPTNHLQLVGNDPNSWMARIVNNASTCPAFVCGLVVDVGAGGAIEGYNMGISGPTTGVQGQTFSVFGGTAAILGQHRTMQVVSYGPAGVRGEAPADFGVLGFPKPRVSRDLS